MFQRKRQNSYLKGGRKGTKFLVRKYLGKKKKWKPTFPLRRANIRTHTYFVFNKARQEDAGTAENNKDLLTFLNFSV